MRTKSDEKLGNITREISPRDEAATGVGQANLVVCTVWNTCCAYNFHVSYVAMKISYQSTTCELASSFLLSSD